MSLLPLKRLLPVRPYATHCLLAGLVSGAAATPLAAQTAEVRNLATDTLQPTDYKLFYPISRIRTNGGQTLHVFVSEITPAGNGIRFTWRNPATRPRPKDVIITTKQIKWLWMEKSYYEPVRLAGQEAGDLAQRLATGPRWELFDVATLKKGVPIPVPGLVFNTFVWTGALHPNYNHAWYVRRPGEALMQALPKGRTFAPALAALLADAPALAAPIQAKAAGYEYDNVPQLIDRYNKMAADAPATR